MKQSLSVVPPPLVDTGPLRAVDVFIKYLEAEGVKTVFGIPGGLLHPLFEALESSTSVRLVVTKHEEGAAFMADGYARVGGSISVCAGTAGPGSTNLLTGVSCAFADGVPLLVVTGQAASHAIGKGAAQETGREDMDIVTMFKPVTKYSAMVTSAASLSQHVRRAFRLALTARPGPVHLNIPVDLWEEKVNEDWFDPKTYRPDTSTFNRRKVQDAADVLADAVHPVILAGAGVGVANARDALISLAELLSAKVVTSPRGKGIFPEDHPLSRGVFGFAGHRSARELVLGDEVDALLVVGASLNETTTLNWQSSLLPNGALLHLDIDADRIGRNYPVDIPLVGDARVILIEIVYHLHRLIRERGQGCVSWASPVVGREDPDEHYLDPELRASERLPLTPQRWRVDFQQVLPKNAIIFSDIGGHMLFNIHHLSIGRGQRFVINLGFGSMGHGTAAPVGAALAHPDRPVFSIVGDACFAMNGMEMITAREHGIPVVWVVENNNMHGITWHGSKRVGRKIPLESIRYNHRLDVASIARAMGLSSWIVDAPGQMIQAVEEALSLNRPSVIEVRVDPTISPPLGDRAKSVAGFIKK